MFFQKRKGLFVYLALQKMSQVTQSIDLMPTGNLAHVFQSRKRMKFTQCQETYQRANALESTLLKHGLCPAANLGA